MKECLNAKQIPKMIKVKLPVIEEEIFKEHFCTECPYYAGRGEKLPRCMKKACAWDNDEVSFSKELMELLPIIEEEYQIQEQKYLEVKRTREIILDMFAKEFAFLEKQKDPCYGCSFGKHAPCIGFCYKQMTANPKER